MICTTVPNTAWSLVSLMRHRSQKLRSGRKGGVSSPPFHKISRQTTMPPCAWSPWLSELVAVAAKLTHVPTCRLTMSNWRQRQA